jgi:hypothetical protein
MNEQLPGVKLTSIQIDAASPDLIGTLMQQITDKVIQAIPEGTFEKIADEVISHGSVVYKGKTGYGSDATIKYELSNEAKHYAANLIDKKLKELVEKYIQSSETKKAIVDLVEIGMAEALKEIPVIVAKQASQRMTNCFMGNQQEDFERLNNIKTFERVQKISQELYQKNILSSFI